MIKQFNTLIALTMMLFTSIGTLKAQCDFTIVANPYACKGVLYAIKATGANVQNYSFTTNSGVAPLDIDNDTTGNFAIQLGPDDVSTISYTIKAYCANGTKTITRTVQIKNLGATVYQDDSICHQPTSLTVVPSGYVSVPLYEWRDAYGTLVSINSWVTITSLIPMTYTYTLTDTASRCSFTGTVTPKTNCCANNLFTGSSLPSNNVVWNSSLMVKDIVRIKSGQTLTIQNINTYFEPCAGIIVEPGGSLFVVRAELLSCSGQLWRGIEVWGNANSADRTVPSSAHGYAQITNGSYIHNAEIGILAGKYEATSDHSYNFDYSGGIIKVRKTQFSNNVRDLVFINYPFEYEGTNDATVTNCWFSTTDKSGVCRINFDKFDILNAERRKSVILSGIKDITLQNNVFLAEDLGLEAHAITVRENAESPNNWSKNTCISSEVALLGNRFERYLYGINMEQTNKSEVISNRFAKGVYGMLYLTKNVASGTVWVADNTFDTLSKAGLVIAPEENPFTGTNSKTSWVTDLKTCSNIFANCFIGIAGSNSIVDQGNSSVAAGNIFNVTVPRNIFWDNNSTSDLSYFSLINRPLNSLSFVNVGFIYNSNPSGSFTSNLNETRNPTNTICDYSRNIVYRLSKSADLEFLLQIYPNPVSNQLTINFSEIFSRDLIVSIIDINGRSVALEKLNSGIQYYTLSTKDLNAGLYMLQVTFPNGISKTAKFIKLND